MKYFKACIFVFLLFSCGNPSNIPIYPNAEQIYHNETKTTTQYWTKEPSSIVLGFYRSELKDWELVDSNDETLIHSGMMLYRREGDGILIISHLHDNGFTVTEIQKDSFENTLRRFNASR